MTTVHTTPSGHNVRLSVQHAAIMYPDDVAQQLRFAALARDGRHGDVLAALHNAELACLAQALGIKEQAL